MRLKLAALFLAASCICANAQTINGTPTSLFYTGLTAQGINTDGISTLLISGSPAYTGTGTFAGLRDNSVYTMSGSSTPNVDSILINSHITGAANLANYEGVMVNQTLDAGYTGTGTAVIGFEYNVFTNNSTLKIPNFRGVLIDAQSAGTGCASGTCTSIGFAENGLTGASGGGTLNNYSIYDVVPSGGAVTGTTNNRGIYLTGNGGTNAGGTTNNNAIYSDSTAQSQFAGILRLGGISTLTFPTMATSAGQQLFAIDATTINDSTDSGTVASVNINKIFGTALTSTSATTFTTTSELDIEPPTCSGNLTCTNLVALRVGGNVTVTGALSMVTTNINQIANILANTSTAYELLNTTPTATVPDVITNRGDTTTGVGGASGHFGAIAGGVSQIDCISTGCTIPLLATLQAGITETGATASLNASSNFATNINTGTSSGIITIGNSGNTGKTTLAGLTTGTNQDVLCLSSTNIALLQAAASCTISSKRFKNLFGKFKGDALAILGKLDVYNYAYKEKNKHDPNGNEKRVGIIAEDVAKYVPECAVYDSAKGKFTLDRRGHRVPKSYDSNCMIGVLIKAVQQQQVEIAALKARH